MQGLFVLINSDIHAIRVYTREHRHDLLTL